jgi:hypothetical protein
MAAALIAAAVPCQNFRSSPAAAGTTEQATNSTVPWNAQAARYQQIHGDLRGTPMNVQAIALRRDGATTAYANAIARIVDAELSMAASDWAARSRTFASNYAGSPVRVVARRSINLPDLRTHVATPEPWSFVIPLDAPYAYSGQNDLLWEIVIHSTTSGGAYPLDAYTVTTVTGTPAAYGTGCIATGRTQRMTLNGTAALNLASTPHNVSLAWSLTQAAPSAPSAVLVSSQRADLPAGLCGNLYVGSVFLTLGGVASASGAFTTPTIGTPYQPAYSGLQLWAQGLCADAGQPVVPAALSNGLELTVPAFPDKVNRVYATSTTATQGTLDVAPYGVAVRFTH